jgi:hypothetical protein
VPILLAAPVCASSIFFFFRGEQIQPCPEWRRLYLKKECGFMHKNQLEHIRMLLKQGNIDGNPNAAGFPFWSTALF